MGNDFLPTTDSGLLTYAQDFALNMAAVAESIDMPDAEIAAYAAKVTAYGSALATSSNVTTRTKPAIVVKDTNKQIVIAATRAIAKQLQGMQTMTNNMRARLNLPIRKQNRPVPAPDLRPSLDIENVVDRTITAHVHGATSPRGKKPQGTVAAWLYTYVGENYPTDPTLWLYQGAFTRPKCVFTLSSSVPAGARMWVCAAWASATGKTGPISVPISTNVQGGGENAEQAAIKIAA